MAEETIVVPVAELATVEEPSFSKNEMYDELVTCLEDFVKVIKMRKDGKIPFPEPEPSADEDGKKKKEKKNRPPRAPSAYNIFMKSVQDKVKLQYPDLKQTELMKHIAALWNSSDEKKVSDAKRAEALEAAKKEKKAKKAEEEDEDDDKKESDDKKDDGKAKKQKREGEDSSKSKKKSKKSDEK
mmetsp:Transcript_49642/g.94864  ORF Transcript_49642/g.94864 Transcript_49642/m.94864 type:complete len:184 (-) Transcript_49642:491-1042(-)|eukprot:CAMPEP_0114257370 /NCGR_PEP_ID=MMETSP0058-20121206/18691_1 /TAXON_ID=36894 /ORGANISM="Pyramimonas parkeae, CCMP726" /LENGTH=183 /DNA_ID=CAMNT_0001372081 /DNA_START=242 /DNA_END=793 /DNA_ORIENTATION=-